MIKAFPKTHVFAAGTVGIVLTSILAFSPSSEVEAKRVSLPLEINDAEQKIDASADLQKLNLETVSGSQKSQQNAITNAKLKPSLAPKETWDSFKIKDGHTLSKLFSLAGLNDKAMYEVIYSSKKNKSLSSIYPGETIHFLTDSHNGLSKIKLERDRLKYELFTRQENGKFVKETVEIEPDIHIAYAKGQINSSLFLAGTKAGLKDSQTMELANIFGWDIDFVLDIRQGDNFSLIYEEKFLDGEKIGNGRILAATFTNRGKEHKAVLYKQPDGLSNYFTPDGKSMRKAFLRTPVDFARISSHFNLKRRHPVLHKIRAHRGTDYAAPTGTPVKASGDGKVIYASRKGGYGKTVILQHGQKISTLYAHLHNYARGIRSGKRVKQGQIIGYVGSTGMSTGPHLHYEFRVNGVHKNPVKVKLPHAKPIPKKQLAEFKKQTSVHLAQLDTFSESFQVASNN